MIKISASFEMRESESNPKFDHCEASFTGKASSLPIQETPFLIGSSTQFSSVQSAISFNQ